METERDENETHRELREIAESTRIATPPCVHGDDETVHAEAWEWALSVARKWQGEAPPMADGPWLHFDYGLWAKHGPSTFDSCPKHLDDCKLVNRGLMNDAWSHVCQFPDKMVSADASKETGAANDEAEAAEREAEAWARDWAVRLHNEAPAPSKDYLGHIMHKRRRLWSEEVRSTFPQHLRKYGFKPGDMALHAMEHYAVERHDEDFPRHP